MDMRRGWTVCAIALCLGILLGPTAATSQPASSGQYPESLLTGLHWRDVGPMRGGRSYGVAGNACHPAGTPAPRAEGGPVQFFRGAPALKPGEDTVRLTVDGQTYTQPVTVKPDPRHTPADADAPAAGNDDDDL